MAGACTCHWHIDVVIQKKHVNAHFTEPLPVPAREESARRCRVIEHDLLRPNTRCSVPDPICIRIMARGLPKNRWFESKHQKFHHSVNSIKKSLHLVHT